MYVVLTGGVPPFAQSMARSSCRGMCTDALQQVVSGALHTGLDSSRPNSPYPRCAQVSSMAVPHSPCCVSPHVARHSGCARQIGNCL